MARSLKFEFAARNLSDSPFLNLHMFPILRRCLFMSSYEGAISEITVIVGIHVKPKKGRQSHEVVLTTSRGFKLDRTPDGWEIKPLHKQAVALSEAFLIKKGWKFDALVPFMNLKP